MNHRFSDFITASLFRDLIDESMSKSAKTRVHFPGYSLLGEWAIQWLDRLKTEVLITLVGRQEFLAKTNLPLINYASTVRSRFLLSHSYTNHQHGYRRARKP